MATAESVKAKLQGLIDKANGATGNADTDLTSAVNTLVGGYGKGDSTPTQEKSVTIKQNGTSEVIADEGYALSKVTINTNVESGKQNYCLVRFYNDDRTTLLYEIIVPYGTSVVYAGITPISTKSEPLTEYIFNGFEPSTANVTEDMNCYAVYEENILADPSRLNATSWEQISAYSRDGVAENYFAVGDQKAITLNGTVGTLELNNISLYVYIIGFDHNKDITGDTGITFGTFKSADGTDVTLCDSKFLNTSSDGTKYFNIDHFGSESYGGWAGCDMRYDILGSTDVAPSSYGAKKTVSSVGYDASATCATNPVANTLMAALPADLRAAMKPMTIYTNNKGHWSSVKLETDVTASVDYLPLLAEYEVFGVRKNANEYEKNKQAQYAYFEAGNPRVKYRHSSTGSTAYWWLRSVFDGNGNSFCLVANYSYYGGLPISYGIAPIFLV